VEFLFSAVVFLVAGVFVWCRGRSHGLGDAPLWFVVSSLVFINVGFFARAVQLEGASRTWAWDGTLVVSLGLLCFMAGSRMSEMFALGERIDARSSATRRNDEQTERPPVSQELAVRRLVVVAAVTLVPAWLYFLLLGYVPLFQGISAMASNGLEGAGALQASRLSRDAYVSAKATHIPMQGLMELARNIGAPIVASYSLSQWVKYGYTRTRLAVLCASILTVLLAGQRWPIAYLALALTAALSLSSGTRSWRNAAKIFPVVAILGIAMTVMQNRTNTQFASWWQSVLSAVSNLAGRIFYDQSYMSLESYRIGAFRAGELEGASYLMSLTAYMPGPGESFPVEFYRRVSGVDAGWTAAPDFYTEAYINFGVVGLIALSMIWGGFVTVVAKLRWSREAALETGVRAGLLAVLAQSCYTGPVFTVGAFLLMLLVLLAVRLAAPLPSPRRRGAVRSKGGTRGR